jgi:hypothetical protein
MKKPYIINLPIKFVDLQDCLRGRYKKRKHRQHEYEPFIEININQKMFPKINTLYHEFTHMVFDFIYQISRKDIKDKDLKVANIGLLNKQQEEKFATIIGDSAEGLFKKRLIR